MFHVHHLASFQFDFIPLTWHKHTNLKAISPGASSSKQIKAYQCICLSII